MPILSLLLLQVAPLELICGGGGSANKRDAASIYGADNRGNSGWATVQTTREAGFEDQVDVIIDGSTSRIRLPRMMLPPIRGGKDGWFDLKDVVVTDNSITATATVNVINHPKVNIDRRSGTISIDGKAGHYSGRCERAPEAGQANRF
jgi:hypothetical protein